MHFYKRKLRHARLRYDTFRKVIADRAVTWDENTNLISGSYDECWRIFKCRPTSSANYATPFARVYRSQGEMRWWELKEIFGGDEITASDETKDEDVDEGSEDQSGSHHRTEQVEGGNEVIDVTTTLEDE
ncbi:UNVERIFIED_CONTAM: hypothetical protein Sindi_1288500 [Sesamum indicum]